MSITSNITSSITSSITESIMGQVLKSPNANPRYQLTSIQEGKTKNQLFIETLDVIEDWIKLNGTDSGNMIQTDQTRKPLYKANLFNGRPSVDFDGVTDRLIGENNDILGFTGDFTIFFAVSVDDFGTWRNLLLKSVSANSTYRIRINKTTGLVWILINDGAGFVFFESDFGVPVDEPCIVTLRVIMATTSPAADGEIKFFINGQDAGTRALVGKTAIATENSPATLGAYQPDSNLEIFKGKMAEVIAYNRALSLSEIGAEHNYLSQKFGIPLT